MVLAYAALTRSNIKAFRIWIASTAILGMTFLSFQVFEFRDFANHEVHFECAAVSELTAFEKTFVDKCAGATEVKEQHGADSPDQPVRHHLLHADGLPRGPCDSGRDLALIPVLLLVPGRRHGPEEPGRGLGRAVLALR